MRSVYTPEGKGCAITVILVIAAVVIFFVMLFTTILPENDYKKGLEAFEEGDYELAIMHLEDLDDYKSSKLMLQKSHYLFAEKYYKEKNFEKAMQHFQAAGDYEDSEERVIESHKQLLMAQGQFKELIQEYRLTELYFPEGLKEIGGYAISGMAIVTTVHIPISVRKIDWGAFQDCSALVSIYYEGTMAEWHMISKNWYWDSHTGDYTVYCSDGNIAKPKE